MCPTECLCDKWCGSVRCVHCGLCVVNAACLCEGWAQWSVCAVSGVFLCGLLTVVCVNVVCQYSVCTVEYVW